MNATTGGVRGWAAVGGAPRERGREGAWPMTFALLYFERDVVLPVKSEMA